MKYQIGDYVFSAHFRFHGNVGRILSVSDDKLSYYVKFKVYKHPVFKSEVNIRLATDSEALQARLTGQ